MEFGLTATEDMDLLFDARRAIRFASSHEVSERSLMAILRKVDRSFQRDRQKFRAVGRDGYLVDFIKPMPYPPWVKDRDTIDNPRGDPGDQNGSDDDLEAIGIDGLNWLESSPLFEAIAIDERGAPLSIAAPDPRAFAAHKYWLSRRADREPIKRKRDEAQAKVVAQLVSRYLTHLPYDHDAVKALPRELFEMAKPLFHNDTDDT